MRLGLAHRPLPAFGHPPRHGEDLGDQSGVGVGAPDWLWLPLSSRERGLGGEVGGQPQPAWHDKPIYA